MPLVVVLGDLHAGSAFAPCPATIQAEDDLTVGASRVQTWLRQCWEHFTDDFVPSIVGRRPYIVVTTGDLIEGVHHGGSQLVWRSEPRHADIAVELLRPLTKKAKAVYCISGTETHTKSWEEDIGNRLGAVQDEQTGRYAPDWLDLDVRGVLTSARHHVGTSSRRALLATQLSMQLIEEQVGAAGSGGKIPRVVIRAHRHTYGTYSDGDGMTVVTPAWQLLTRFGHKVVPAAQRSLKVGGVVLDYSRCSDPFDLPSVHAKLYRPT